MLSTVSLLELRDGAVYEDGSTKDVGGTATIKASLGLQKDAASDAPTSRRTGLRESC